MRPKTIILTIDYEVFLGNRTGDLETVLIQPTYDLMNILRKNNSRMTVFWDIMHYNRICELCANNNELQLQKKLIEKQITDLVIAGHDIQLHLHPHWLDAKYEDGKWVFEYSRFALTTLSSKKDQNDINSIFGCVYQMKRLMESLIRPIDADYCVKTFRAGGYLLEPFTELKDTFLELGITVDSSICPGLKSKVERYSYDFRKYPKLLMYNFSDSPKKVDKDGLFTELPIYTIKLSAWFRTKKWIKRKHGKLDNIMEQGIGVRFPLKKTTRFRKIIDFLFFDGIMQLTLDGIDNETFRYCLSKSPNNAIMILHPKKINKINLSDLESCIDADKLRFNSINNLKFELKK
jgi:hypothetical protein